MVNLQLVGLLLRSSMLALRSPKAGADWGGGLDLYSSDHYARFSLLSWIPWSRKFRVAAIHRDNFQEKGEDKRASAMPRS